MKWTIWKFPIDYEKIKDWKGGASQENVGQDSRSTVYKGSFLLEKVGDTYLDLSEYGKGYIWINGHNLGRYWHVGPQKRLFCPGAWLKEG